MPQIPIRSLSGLLTIAAVLASAYASVSEPIRDEAVPMVRGSDLSQFDLVGIGPESIVIAEGEVRLTGRPFGYFATRTDHANYVLSFEWKYDRPADLKSDAEFRGNSGLMVHMAGPRKVWPDCVQVQLAQADPGAIFGVGNGRIEGRSDPAAQKKAVKPVGEWNRAEVTCRGRAITCLINGIEVARGEGSEPDRGLIGWQSEGSPIRFREIRIKALP